MASSLGLRVSRAALTTIFLPYVIVPHISSLLTHNLYSSGYFVRMNGPVTAYSVTAYPVAAVRSLIWPRVFPVSHHPRPYKPRSEKLHRLLQALGTVFGMHQICGRPLLERWRSFMGRDQTSTLTRMTWCSECNWAFGAVALAIADPGDEFILPVPW